MGLLPPAPAEPAPKPLAPELAPQKCQGSGAFEPYLWLGLFNTSYSITCPPLCVGVAWPMPAWALSCAGAGSLSMRLALLTDGQRYIGGYQFCAAST